MHNGTYQQQLENFSNVFASLFEHHNNHQCVIRALADNRKGLTRTKLLALSGSTSGGRLTTTLNELEESGFVEKYLPIGKKSGALYRINDEYSMFYLKFIEGSRPASGRVWSKLFNKPSYKIWSGFSFENVCLKHVDEIRAGLQIHGVHAETGSWVEKNKVKGAQIDLLLDRDDNVINLCEMKFYAGRFKITKKYYTEIK